MTTFQFIPSHTDSCEWVFDHMTAQLSFCCQKDLDPLSQCKWIHCRHPKNTSVNILHYKRKKMELFSKRWPWIWYNTHHIVLIAPSQDQRVGTIITPSMNTSYMWPVDAWFTDLENNNNLKKIRTNNNFTNQQTTCLITFARLTWTLNFHWEPTGTPGMGP